MKQYRLFALMLGAILIFQAHGVHADENSSAPQPGVVKKNSVLLPEEVISADELKELVDRKSDLIVFDARARKSYNAGHIQDAVLPMDPEYYRQHELFLQKIISTAPDRTRALGEAMNKLPKEKPIVTYCNRDCSASVSLLLELKRLGFTRVRAMEEGFQAWEEKGYPTA